VSIIEREWASVLDLSCDLIFYRKKFLI